MNLEFNHKQKILYNYLNATFDIDTIVPLFYQGAIAGSEFLTYDAKKLYLVLNINFAIAGVETPAANQIAFRNEADAVFYYLKNEMCFLEPGGPVVLFYSSNAELENLYFSRIVNTGFNDIKFIGYRITLV